MNSPEPSAMERTKLSARVRLPSNWIELFAVPIAASVMETQPIIIIFLFGLPLFTEESNVLPLPEGIITVLLLGFHWWAMFVEYRTQHGQSERQANFLYLLVLFATLAVTLGTLIAFGSSIPALFFSGAFVIWCWRRGMMWARTGLSDERLVTSFKIGFIVLIAGLFLAVINAVTSINPLYVISLDVVTRALPIFFFSGLIGLSFTRLGIIRKENARHAPVGSQFDPTRSWLIVLTLLWSATVAIALALEIFSFQAIVTVLQPLWNALGTIVGWILYAIIFLLNAILYLFYLLFGHPRPPVPPRAPAQPTTHNPSSHGPLPHNALLDTLITIGRWALLIVVVVIVLLVIRALLQRWHHPAEDDAEEEVREGLSVREILKARRQEREKRREQKREDFQLDSLDPNSARARYRELLQAMAWNKDDLGRRPNETPLEYQRRLLVLMKQAPPDEAQKDDTPPDPAILDELTRAYAQERYGGRQVKQQQAYLHTWVPHLVKRLTGGAPTNTPGQQTRQSMDKRG